MKTWNAAEIVELNIAETANGFFPFFGESCLTHGVSCPDSGKGEGEGKGDNSTTETLS